MTRAARIISPGSTIGVLGGGQLGRMFAMAARRLGYRVHTLAPDDDTPTGQIADVEINAPYDDLDAVRRFAQGVDVVTFEFENVSAGAAAEAEAHAVVRPNGRALADRAAPHPREDVRRRPRRAGDAVRAGQNRRGSRGRRGSRRHPRGAEDRVVRVRRQGTGRRARVERARAPRGTPSGGARRFSRRSSISSVRSRSSARGASAPSGRTSGRSRTRTPGTSSTCRWRPRV